MKPEFCITCGHWHLCWITCYGAAKTRYEEETGKEFWTGRPIAQKSNRTKVYMLTKIIEATNRVNWGKFLIGRFSEEEWARRCQMDGSNPKRSLLSEIGWDHSNIWVLDLQTGEGACYRPGGLAKADLEKHKIWVCPLYESFLTWLYKQDITNLETLPDVIDLEAESSLYGYRRSGKSES